MVALVLEILKMLTSTGVVMFVAVVVFILYLIFRGDE